jgi:hypothetical protein
MRGDGATLVIALIGLDVLHDQCGAPGTGARGAAGHLGYAVDGWLMTGYAAVHVGRSHPGDADPRRV